MHELKIKYKSIGSLNYSELCFSFREVAGLVVGVGRGGISWFKAYFGWLQNAVLA